MLRNTVPRFENRMRKKDISITLSCFLMKCSGCWMARNDSERRLRTFAEAYTFLMLFFGIYIDLSDIFHSLDDIDAQLYLNKTRFLKLAKHMKTKYWDIEYDEDEQVYVESTRKFFTYVIVITYGCMLYVVLGYTWIPIYETVRGNASVRVFPIRMWPILGIPLYDTPYFEILFVVQALCCLQVGVTFVSLDNFLVLINTHIACQFQILQHRFTNLCDTGSKVIEQPDYADKCYKNLKECIRQHQALIEYCGKAEAVFSFNILSYVLVFSVGTCLSMYQALLGDITIERRMCFISYLGGILFQLVLITYSCGSMITESTNVGLVVYATLWPALSTNRSGRMLRRDVHMVILRSQKPCQLTAGGFFPVSLETSTKLVSTAVSYFTLLKKSSE
ncbi:odorant receptor 13a-like isoform X2 [Augochlora pura]